MKEDEYKDATEKQAPLHAQAEDTLNRIRESLLSRAATIEGEQKRLSDEYSHVMNVLNRIAPPTPQAIGAGYQVPSSGTPIRGW